MKLFFCIGELKMSGLVFSVSASLCPFLHIPSSDCRNCKPLFGVDVRNNPNHTTAQNPLKAKWVWRDRLFYVEVGEWQSLQVGIVCEVSPEVLSGVQRRAQPTCTWSGEGKCGTAASCQKPWRRQHKNCALRDGPVVQVTVNGLLV